MIETSSAPGFGIYIHWPFCLSKCPYCDFNSHVADAVDQGRWRRAMLAELDYFAQETTGRRVGSIFFGGGTPSLMDPATAAALIDRIHALWPVDGNVEITLEANPGTVEAQRFRQFRDAGINRLSIGIQALDDESLRFLGRHHSVAEALQALAIAAATFERYSFDLIYARPGQTLQDWRAELARGLDLAGEHLSLYQLTIEKGTAFHPAHARGAFELPPDDICADMFDLTNDMAEHAGRPAYEISNHARPGAECRHNLLYWQGGEYVGIGPGAHGRLRNPSGIDATCQHHNPEAWLVAVESQGHGTKAREALDCRIRAEELVMMGLRLTAGIDTARFHAASGRPLATMLDSKGLSRMVEGGFVTWDGTTLAATASGRKLLNSVLAAVLV